MFYQPARQQFDQSYSPFSGGLGQFGYSTFGSPFGFAGSGGNFGGNFGDHFGGFGGGGNFGGFDGFGGGYSPFGFGGGYSPFGFGGGYGGFNPMMGGLGQFGYSPFGFGGGFGNFNPFFSGIGGLGQFGQQQNMQPINPGNTNFNALKQDFRNMPTEAYMFGSSPLRATPLREPGSLTMDVKPDEAYRSELMERFGLGVNRGQREAGMRNAMDAATNPLDDSRMGVENARSARENWFRKSPEQQQRLLNQSQQLQTLGVNSPQMQAFLG